MDKGLLEEIVKREWELFQQVHNEGGRADCQDNWGTFHLMRSAQYAAWPESLLAELNRDLTESAAAGRNLVMEKYARMMASTAPERYREMESFLPELPPEVVRLAEEIIAIHKKWMAEHAALYPRLSSKGRPLYTEQDSEWNTSSETYLRGELLTWSAATLEKYLEFAEECLIHGRNLVIEQDEYTLHSYGWRSIREAEAALGR